MENDSRNRPAEKRRDSDRGVAAAAGYFISNTTGTFSMRSPEIRCSRLRPLAIFSIVALTVIAGCNRAAMRIPGASLSFPTSPVGFVAPTKSPLSLWVAMPVDGRVAHYGEPIAGSRWTAVQTDGLWISTTPSVVQARLQADLAASGLFSRVSSEPTPTSDLKLSTEVDAFCSQVRGFLFARVAGIVAVKFKIERNGNVLFERRFDRVVTDADPEYTGWQVATIEQAMNRAVSDSLRELLRSFLEEIAGEVPKWQSAGATTPSS
jgi:ABC-type uncharacterized transport system auxiliary subunit